MGFRDDQLAGHERARSLEQEVERLKAENSALRATSEGASEAAQRPPAAHRLAGPLGAFAVVAAVGALLVPIPQARVLLVVVAVFLAILAVFFGVFAGLVHVVQPGEVLVLSGMQRPGPDGVARGYRVIRGGRVLRMPLVETATRMALGPFPFTVTVRGLYTRSGAVDLHGRASVGVSREPSIMDHAIERFLGRPSEEVVEVARQTLEGALRSVGAELEAEDLRGAPLRLTEKLLAQGLDVDLERLGLSLDTLVVEDVSER